MAKKKVTKKVTTKKPTGLSITRDGEWYTVKWKIGDANYDDGQQLQYKLSYQKKWHDLSVGRKTTSKSLKLERKDFYPNSGKPKLTSVKFRIRGNRQEYKKETSKQETTYKCSWSDWAPKEFVISVPFKPTATVTLNNELTNVCTFGWNVEGSANRPFTSIKWESRLAPKESNTTDGSKLTWKSTMAGWRSGTSVNASGSFDITEDTDVLANGSYTRWVRFIARGVAGASTGKPDGWTYVKHVYSVPFRPTIKSVNAQENDVGGFSCKVVWEAGSSSAHPIDKTTVQYTIVEPEEELSCPSGASWTDANISRDTSGKDAAFFSIDDTLSRDQCLFVRVNVQHDSHITYGTPKLAKVGYLKDPTGLSVQTDNVTHRATITATNASNIEDSFLAVVYQTASDPEGAFVVGIIPHGSSSVIVQCPDWSQESAVSFGVYAVVGDYKRQTRSDGVYTYVVNEQMRSKNTIRDGGTVPTAPSNVAVVQTSVKETVQVTWDWTWDEANGAEISWADHEDAWESTDEPETYVISKLHAAKWNISGLDAGKTWYIRVRLVNETAEATTNSPWSEAVAIDLSSAPTTPTLYLSSAVIPQDGSVTASWAYSTTDGTMQAYAEICEATIGSGGITYGDIIAHTETAQQTVINAKDAGWQSGETHNLCVRVTSASGHVSDSWSDPIAITVAEPLVCEITNTSLVQEHIENNPREFESADIVTFETDVEEDVTKLQVNLEPVQDLHGYDHPWVGGGGANKYDNSIAVDNSRFSTTGTAAVDGLSRSDYIEITPNASYYFMGVTPNNSGYSGVFWYDENKAFVREDGVSGATPSTPVNLAVTAPSTAKYVGINMFTTNKDNGAVNYPSTVTSWTPYENICPISGWNSVNLYKSGKNVFGGTTKNNKNLNGSGNEETDYSRSCTTAIVIDAGEAYTISYAENVDCGIFYYDKNNTFLSLQGWASKPRTFTPPANTAFVRFAFKQGTAPTNIQVEQGTTATDYEPYKGTTTPVNLGRTVYGGTLDVVSGVLTVAWGIVLGTAWTQYNASNGYKAYRVYNVPQAKVGGIGKSNMISEYGSFNSGAMTKNIIQLPDGTGIAYMALDENLSASDVQFVYELKEPQTIQLTPEEVKTLVGENNTWSNAGQVEVRIAEFERDILSLKQMPLSVTAVGSGVGGLTTLAIERAESYHLDRPDESHADGYKDETVFMHSQTGEDPIDVTVDSLMGALDDGAKYRIVATVQDGLGQSAVDTLEFEVRWEHQAVIPEANVVIDDENLVAKITPVAPTGALAGDTCDIYRLSADRPELIVQDATFGQTYVDPYPAIGEFGGHRVVFKTVNGDYITEDNQMAWIDLGEDEDDILDLDYHVIDFDGTRIVLNYNVDLSSQWEKDFTETKYLGGSVQGDWNPAVSRTGSISATAITITDQEMIRDMRRLASYSGLCHVRTKDGSSYAADIQVSEDRSHEDYDKIATFSMTVTRVDPERLEGLTLEVWQGEQ